MVSTFACLAVDCCPVWGEPQKIAWRFCPRFEMRCSSTGSFFSFWPQHNFLSLIAGANNPFPNAAPGVQLAKQKNPATRQMRARLVLGSERISELFLCRIPK